MGVVRQESGRYLVRHRTGGGQKRRSLGTFASEVAAAEAYARDRAERNEYPEPPVETFASRPLIPIRAGVAHTDAALQAQAAQPRQLGIAHMAACAAACQEFGFHGPTSVTALLAAIHERQASGTQRAGMEIGVCTNALSCRPHVCPPFALHALRMPSMCCALHLPSAHALRPHVCPPFALRALRMPSMCAPCAPSALRTRSALPQLPSVCAPSVLHLQEMQWTHGSSQIPTTSSRREHLSHLTARIPAKRTPTFGLAKQEEKSPRSSIAAARRCP